MFSVVIPAYNAEKCIGRAIKSILEQTLQEYEIIVVDDGSTDKTCDIVKSFLSEKIHLFSQANSGVSIARNVGIKESSFQFICFLDADDEWKRNHLEFLADAIHAFPQKKFFTTLSVTELLDGTIIDQIENKKGIFQTKAFYVDDFLEFEKRNAYTKTFNTNCVCVRKDMFEKYGFFEEGEKISEDVDMWNRIMLFEGKVVIPEKTVVRHRDYSFATSKIPKGAPFIFNRRINGYLQDPSVSLKKKEELKDLYSVMELTSVRSLIIFGKKCSAYKRLRKVDKKYIAKKKLLQTWLSFLVPSMLLRMYVRKRDKNYYRSGI